MNRRGQALGWLLSGLALFCFIQTGPAETGKKGGKAAGSGPQILPIPLKIDLDAKKVSLGDKLFHDTKLSGDDTVSCATCHNLKTGGTDLAAKSTGVKGRLGPINSPTVFNSGYNVKQFWDGRAGTLEEQVNGPTHNPLEMDSNWDQILAKLAKDPDYVSAFQESYPQGISSAAVRDAIAAFERSLITPNSRFDKYLRGDAGAITQEEKEGYRLFVRYGCIECHNGENVGGNSFRKFGLKKDYFAARGNLTQADNGRYNVTKDEKDRHLFKVPGLRTAAITPPYFHDGSAATLEEAVRADGIYQAGRSLSDQEVKQLAQFIKSLTGEYNGEPLLGETW